MSLFEHRPSPQARVPSAEGLEEARALHEEAPPYPDFEAEPASDRGEIRRLSGIMPTLNEEANLNHLLPILRAELPHEIIVSDGGSSDETVAAAHRHGASVVVTQRGRASQMNAGARVATGDMLLFLHADTLPPQEFCAVVSKCLDMPGVAAGSFRFSLGENFPGRFVIECLVRLRCGLFSTPYGDQGLFVRRPLFESVGGFPDWPILEDLELLHRLRKAGKVVVTRESAVTSARRWTSGGVVRTFLRHQLILFGKWAGLPPSQLARWR